MSMSFNNIHEVSFAIMGLIGKIFIITATLFLINERDEKLLFMRILDVVRRRSA
jgi:hypothetical protein